MSKKPPSYDDFTSQMDLDPDLKGMYHFYQTASSMCKYLAIGTSTLGSIGIIYMIQRLKGSGIEPGELGSYIGGTFGPFFTLVGFFILLATLYSQQSQAIFQNQAIRNQNRQFTLQSFDNSFFNLLNHYLLFVAECTIQVKKERFTVFSFKRKLDSWRPYFEEYMKLTGSSTDIPPEELKQWLYDELSNKQNQVKNLFKPLVSILFYIKDGKITDKEKYYKMLDYQVTEAEKFILFYFFITTPSYFTPEEKPVVSTFLMRIDSKTLIHPNHTSWLDA